MLHPSLLTYYDGLEYILFTENELLKLNIKINKKRNIFINLSQDKQYLLKHKSFTENSVLIQFIKTIWLTSSIQGN